MKRKTDEWPDDPVVREVRRARRKLWREAGGTIEGLQRLLDRKVPRTETRSATKRGGSRTNG